MMSCRFGKFLCYNSQYFGQYYNKYADQCQNAKYNDHPGQRNAQALTVFNILYVKVKIVHRKTNGWGLSIVVIPLQQHRNKRGAQAVNSARNDVDCQGKIGRNGGFKAQFEYCDGV